MREIGHDHQTYITVSDIRDQDGYADVTAGLLRTWVESGALAIVTIAELAAAFSRKVPADVDGTQPARAPGASGLENVYRWADVVRVETDTRRARRRHGGRTRGRQPGRRPPGLAIAS